MLLLTARPQRSDGSFILASEVRITLRVHVNNEVKDLACEVSLLELINDLNLRPERIAVELNGLVVPRADWPARLLVPGDRIEIVHFVGGGSEEFRICRLGRGQSAASPPLKIDYQSSQGEKIQAG